MGQEVSCIVGLSWNSHIAQGKVKKKSPNACSISPKLYLFPPSFPSQTHTHVHHRHPYRPQEPAWEDEHMSHAPTLEQAGREPRSLWHYTVAPQRLSQQSPMPVCLHAKSQMFPPLEPLELPTKSRLPSHMPSGGPCAFFNSCKFVGPGPGNSTLWVWPLSSLCLLIGYFLIYSDTLSPKCLFCSVVPEPSPRLNFRGLLNSMSIILYACTKYLFLEKGDPKKVKNSYTRMYTHTCLPAWPKFLLGQAHLFVSLISLCLF